MVKWTVTNARALRWSSALRYPLRIEQESAFKQPYARG
jgi:hypothetical protein